MSPPSVILDRPTYSPAQAAGLLADHFGLRGDVTPLPGEHDQNFAVTADTGERFVMKISAASGAEGTVDLQNAVLRWLADRHPELPAPRLVGTLADDPGVDVTAPDGVHHLRVFGFIGGRTLASTNPRSSALLEGLGRHLAKLNLALEGFSHAQQRRVGFDWDLGRAGEVIRRDRDAIADPERRALVEDVLRAHEREALPALERLRRGVIHNDANDHNVIVAPVADGGGIAGLVDFGDVLEAPLVCEPAIAAAYALLGQADPVATAARVVAGYHERLPLTGEDLAVLFHLIRARLAVSVCISARRSADGADDPYLSVSEDQAWEALERLATVHPNLARARLRHACGLTPCPSNERVLEWIRKHRSEAGPLVRPPLSSEGTLILDLSVGSPDLESPESLADAAAWSERIFAAMDGAGASVGVGRYDEPRLCYTGEAFKAGGDERPEQRTVHLGVDLFLPAGAEVLVPLAGRVHSFRDNADALDYGPTIILEHGPEEGPRFFTLYGHLSRASLEGLEVGREVAAGDVLARLGDLDVNGGWPPHLHFQIVTDLLGMEGTFPGVAAPSQREVWLSLSPDPGLLVDLPQGSTAPREPAPETLAAARRASIAPSLSLSYREPLHLVRGWRQTLYDADGRAYLDCVNNVCHVGHSHPRVVDALRRQAALLNTNTRYLHGNLVRYAQRLTALLPDPLEVCYFVNSGSEANELALRLARTFTGREDVVVVDGAYHGNTGACVEISPYKFDGPGGEGAPPHVHVAPLPDDYRGPYRREDLGRAGRYAEGVARALAAARERAGGAAAFICESLPSCAGQIEPPPGYLRAAFAHAREAGALSIADEVQVGFGRVGAHFWGFQTQDVVPDVVTLGKPMGNGHPLGAVVTTREIAEAFHNGMEYFNTFGGNPVSCAVGLAVLDVMESEGLQEHARVVGDRLRALLAGLMAEHAVVGDVRGRGLFLGVELVRDPQSREPNPIAAAYAVERMREHGILLSTDGSHHDVLKIKPPLPFDERDAERLASALDRVLAEDPVRASLDA